MAQFNFKGDLDNVSGGQLEYVNKVILELGYENSKVTFAAVGKAGDNYVATVKRITIEGENGNLSMVAKFASTNEISRQFMNTASIFRNEHIMYIDVLPKLVQFQKQADVPEEDQLKYAKCYGSNQQQPHEVIILEDLKTLDFIMLDRFVSLTDDCIKSVLKNFAILHSLSYVLRKTQPDEYDKIKKNLVDMWIVQAGTPEGDIFFQSLEDQAIAALEDPNHINVVKHKVSNSLNVAAKLAKVDNNGRYAVIVQGDAWTNNIMFKFEGNKSPESIMIDYQLSRSSSPVTDILYLIFNCTDYDTRKKHFYDWIDHYHNELSKSLSNFDLKANFVYPRDKLDTDLKRYGKFLFGLSIVLASMLIRKSEDAAKVKAIMDDLNPDNMAAQVQEMGITQLDEETRNLFKTRVTGLVQSFTEFGLL